MRYLTLRVQAFGRFAEPFTLPLARQGFVLVEGVNHDEAGAFNSNGACKSLIFEAITWALFGKMARYGDARIGADEVCVHGIPADVAVDFETARGQFTARRVQPLRGPARLHLTVPGQSIDRAEAEEQLRNILGFDYHTHRAALFLHGEGLNVGSERYGEQMSLLESLLRFDVFSDAADVAGRRVKALTEEIRATLDALERQSTLGETARHTIHELETMDETPREHAVMAAVRRLRPLGRQVDEMQARLVEVRNAHTAWIAGAATQAARRDAALRHLGGLNHLEGSCPTCEQRVKPAHVERLRTQTTTVIDQATALWTEAVAQRDSLADSVETVRLSLDEAKTARVDTANLMRELQDIRTRAGRRLAMILTQEERRAAAEAEVVRLTGEIGEARRELHRAQFWQRAYGTDLKAEVLGAAAPVLNEASRRYSDILMNGSFVPVFNPQRESRTENMITLTGTVPTRKAGSSGEKRRIDIVRALSYRAVGRWRLGEPVNLTVWDELLDPLDDSGLRRAISILQQDMDEHETVFMITHNAALKAMFPGARTIRVERMNGRSRLYV